MLPTIKLPASEGLPIQNALPPEVPGAGASDPAGDFFALLQAAPAIDTDATAVAGNGLPDLGSLLPTLRVPDPVLPGPDTGMDEAMPESDPRLQGAEEPAVDEALEPAIAAISLPIPDIASAGPATRESGALSAEMPAIRPSAVVRRTRGDATFAPPESLHRDSEGKERPSVVPAISFETAPDERVSTVQRTGVQPGAHPPLRTQVSVEPAAPEPAVDRERNLPSPDKNLLAGTTGVDETGSTRLRDDVQSSVKAPLNHALQNGSPASESPPLSATGMRLAADAGQLTVRQLVGQEISLPVQEPGWDKKVAERVLLMANSRLQNAEIRLSPADLGPLRVQVAIEDGLANVSFQAQHAVTREAIELALPRLRDMLAESGLSLGQASVGEDGVHREAHDGATEPHADAYGIVDDSEFDGRSENAGAARQGDGLVDTYV